MAPPAPMAPPVPIAPYVVEPVYVDRFAIEDAVQAARAVRVQVDSDAIREANAQAREVAAQAREIAAEARAQARVDMDRMRVEMPRIDMPRFEFQDRAFTFSGMQDNEGGYSSGMSAIQQQQYDRAITMFDRVIAQKSARADAAIYWKAFAQYRLAKWEDATASLGLLRKDFPQSRYLNDAKVLESDVKKMSGQRVDPATLNNDEIKLLAISSLERTDQADQAVPLLEGVLNATNSLQVKRRALYVLALRDEPRARQVLLNYAKGSGNPDLQVQAISYVASRRDKATTSTDLREIYEATQDANIRRAVVDAYRNLGDKVALINIASTSAQPIEIRRSAINGLQNLAAPQELWTIYQKETDKDMRMQMVGVFGSMGAVDQLQQVIQTEKDPEVRRAALRRLGSQKSDKTGAMLVNLYGTEADKDNRLAIISALGSQNNAEALIGIYRKESSPASQELKLQIMRRLSEMAKTNKAAADFMLEVLK
jgi:hypothetical protein